MRLIAITAAFLLLPSLAAGEWVQVPPQPSAAKVQITTLLDGKPVQGVRIDVFPYEGQFGAPAEFSVSTNDKGVARLPELATGRYSLSAWKYQGLGGELNGGLDLDVSPEDPKASSAFSIDLQISAAVAALRNKPPSQRVQDFAGQLVDPSGAGIPKVKIQLWKMGSDDETAPVETRTDSEGRFSVHITQGIWVADFIERGFREEVIVFEVARKAEERELRVSMRIGSC